MSREATMIAPGHVNIEPEPEFSCLVAGCPWKGNYRYFIAKTTPFLNTSFQSYKSRSHAHSPSQLRVSEEKGIRGEFYFSVLSKIV